MGDKLHHDFKKLVSERARAKHSSTLERVLLALNEMKDNHLIINFNSLANYANVSKAWLYRNATIRKQIIDLRGVEESKKRSPDFTAALAKKDKEISVLQDQLTKLQKLNKKLKEQLEIVYGELHKNTSNK